jgi:hypothetical protein
MRQVGLLTGVGKADLMLLHAALRNTEPALGVSDLCAQRLALLAGPIDLAIGAVFDVAGVALLL